MRTVYTKASALRDECAAGCERASATILDSVSRSLGGSSSLSTTTCFRMAANPPERVTVIRTTPLCHRNAQWAVGSGQGSLDNWHAHFALPPACYTPPLERI
jgi:hypothetical protein